MKKLFNHLTSTVLLILMYPVLVLFLVVNPEQMRNFWETLEKFWGFKEKEK